MTRRQDLQIQHHLRPCARRRQLSSRALTAPPSKSISLRQRLYSSPPRQSNTPTTTPSSFFTPSLCRHASTSASAAAPAPSPAPSGPASASSPLQSPASKLDWNTFFKLRAKRRVYSLVFSIVSAAGTFVGAAVAISTVPQVADAITKFVPMDPFISMGIATFGSGLFGWLIGPFFGNAIWRAVYRSRVTEFVSKEKLFFARIKRHRVDPRGAGTNNPVPDYYGEKIGSVHGYRRWLKDQRAFNRKRGH